MASDLCILDKVGCKETGIATSADGIDSAVWGQKVGRRRRRRQGGRGDIGARWEVWLTTPPIPPIALHKLSSKLQARGTIALNSEPWTAERAGLSEQSGWINWN